MKKTKLLILFRKSYSGCLEKSLMNDLESHVQCSLSTMVRHCFLSLHRHTIKACFGLALRF